MLSQILKLAEVWRGGIICIDNEYFAINSIVEYNPANHIYQTEINCKSLSNILMQAAAHVVNLDNEKILAILENSIDFEIRLSEGYLYRIYRSV